jgi:hypothetical protein
MIGAAEQLALADRGVQNPRGRDDQCRNRRTGCGQVAPMFSSVRADENRTRGCRVNRSGLARSPEIAALSMSGISAIVAINALMLKRTKLAGIRARTPGPIDG